MTDDGSERDLDAEADEALAKARAMSSGPAKSEALKKAGLLRRAADDLAILRAKRARPRMARKKHDPSAQPPADTKPARDEEARQVAQEYADDQREMINKLCKPN